MIILKPILIFSQPVPLRGGLRQRVRIMWVGVWMDGWGTVVHFRGSGGELMKILLKVKTMT